MISQIDSLAVGDSFLFKEVEHYGLVLLTIDRNNKIFEHTFFPVLLDSQLNGLDKFLNGQIFISSFIDFTNPKGITEGFQVYYFLEQNPFNLMADQFIKIGNIRLNKNYQNITGGTMARNMEDFKFQLNMFDKMFGENSRLTHLREIIERED